MPGWGILSQLAWEGFRTLGRDLWMRRVCVPPARSHRKDVPGTGTVTTKTSHPLGVVEVQVAEPWYRRSCGDRMRPWKWLEMAVSS